MSSLKKNILYNCIRVGSNLVFPLITFPYVTRILGPESLGLFNYVVAIVGYFTLFASLGFPMYGTREIAQSKNDPEKLEKTTNSIFTAACISCLTMYLIYFVVSITISNSSENFVIFFITGLSILLSCISFEWFFQGIEDFKFITIRSIIVRVVTIACLFLFVKSKEDLVAYAILNVLATCGSNIWNLIYINKYIKLRLNFRDSIKHTKGALTFFLGSIIVSLYTNLNSVMVGALASMAAVAFFTTGNKIVQLGTTFLGAIASSIMPRMAALYQNGDERSIISLQKKTLQLVYYTSIPCVIGMIILAYPLIQIFGGSEFLPSVIVMQILSPIVVIISLSQFLSNQILVPLRKEKYNNYCVSVGALANIIFNVILIPKYAEIGVAISVLCSETIVTIMFFYYASKYMKLKKQDFVPVKCLIASFLMGGYMYYMCTNLNWIYLIHVVIGVIIYFLSLVIMRDIFIISLVKVLLGNKHGK